ncbi:MULTISPECIES: hypothetical protein [Fusobacterium]|uniref:hypothetical protein n=1 Tax=Fusobacterium TaxID=848 RepID=UPI0015A72A6C|nr:MULTISPECIES: hypothetical protein [Fusobacterium]MCF2612090.1 hypothetical protein [Fusobacterium perfoetens]MDY2981374.1 hypothetical protein [Fusobacterium sp.]
MLKISKEDQEFLKEYFDDGFYMIYEMPIDEVLTSIVKFIAQYGTDEEYELNEIGTKAQDIYSRIYKDNVVEE